MVVPFTRHYHCAIIFQMKVVATIGRHVDVQVFPEFRRELPVRWLRQVAKTALSHGLDATATGTNNGAIRSSMSLVIADDETVWNVKSHVIDFVFCSRRVLFHKK